MGWSNIGNVEGQLGPGTDGSHAARVRGMHDAVAIAANQDDSMALTRDGRVWTWGSGALGNGTDANVKVAPAPVRGLSDVIAIAEGIVYSLVLRKDGTVWAWGSDYDGQVGQDATARNGSPLPDSSQARSASRAWAAWWPSRRAWRIAWL